MIDHLNATVWAALGVSKIHGVGVVAIRDIPKGTQVWTKRHMQARPLKLNSFEGLHPFILELIKQRWPLALSGDSFFSPNDDARLLSFMNHSSDPNYDPVTDTVLRDVLEGEELTEDYRIVPNYKEIYLFVDGNR